MVVLETDANLAREVARGPLRFLSGVPGYQASFTRMGFADSDILSLGDELVDQLVAWGSADTITARISEHLQAGADQVVINLLDTGQQSAVDAARQLARGLPV
jgi:hypothetical protein